jgi:hypothetical protein
MGDGQPLPQAQAERMGDALGADFSTVRVQEGGGGIERPGVLAAAQGETLHFAPGQYRPGDPAGDALIAHELAHVVQQRRGARGQLHHSSGEPSALEAEADHAAAAAIAGSRFVITGTASPRTSLFKTIAEELKQDFDKGDLRSAWICIREKAAGTKDPDVLQVIDKSPLSTGDKWIAKHLIAPPDNDKTDFVDPILKGLDQGPSSIRSDGTSLTRRRSRTSRRGRRERGRRTARVRRHANRQRRKLQSEAAIAPSQRRGAVRVGGGLRRRRAPTRPALPTQHSASVPPSRQAACGTQPAPGRVAIPRR